MSILPRCRKPELGVPPEAYAPFFTVIALRVEVSGACMRAMREMARKSATRQIFRTRNAPREKARYLRIVRME
jgi:hypothetical protein